MKHNNSNNEATYRKIRANGNAAREILPLSFSPPATASSVYLPLCRQNRAADAEAMEPAPVIQSCRAFSIYTRNCLYSTLVLTVTVCSLSASGVLCLGRACNLM